MAEGSCTVELSLESKKDFKVVKQIIEKNSDQWSGWTVTYISEYNYIRFESVDVREWAIGLVARINKLLEESDTKKINFSVSAIIYEGYGIYDSFDIEKNNGQVTIRDNDGELDEIHEYDRGWVMDGEDEYESFCEWADYYVSNIRDTFSREDFKKFEGKELYIVNGKVTDDGYLPCSYGAPRELNLEEYLKYQ